MQNNLIALFPASFSRHCRKAVFGKIMGRCESNIVVVVTNQRSRCQCGACGACFLRAGDILFVPERQISKTVCSKNKFGKNLPQSQAPNWEAHEDDLAATFAEYNRRAVRKLPAAMAQEIRQEALGGQS